ncbi:hypothetical protein BpHYR1_030625 [Brachionus plicatilis]|uniref:Transmembrane protein n=1 Tax=Brachionus plicatilis TaxID=10195 RepID=A0A3M7PVF9_BRAPC|nr:hypothetical protein BpHYR1_030625 [Brachionus plicatilis]
MITNFNLAPMIWSYVKFCFFANFYLNRSLLRLKVSNDINIFLFSKCNYYSFKLVLISINFLMFIKFSQDKQQKIVIQ